MSRVALVVDDSSSIRQLVSSTLQGVGFQVLEAGDGQEALDIVDGREIAVVVTDLSMPAMDGPTLIRELKSKPKYKFVPILVLSAQACLGDNLGATAWLVKPVTPEALLHAVERTVRMPTQTS